MCGTAVGVGVGDGDTAGDGPITVSTVPGTPVAVVFPGSMPSTATPMTSAARRSVARGRVDGPAMVSAVPLSSAAV